MRIENLEKYGYLTYDEQLKRYEGLIKKKKIGNLGRAIMKASRLNKSENWLKKQLDEFFKTLRELKNARNK